MLNTNFKMIKQNRIQLTPILQSWLQMKPRRYW